MYHLPGGNGTKPFSGFSDQLELIDCARIIKIKIMLSPKPQYVAYVRYQSTV